jgi:hypothetical protein
MADFSHPAAHPAADAVDDRMRRLACCLLIALLGRPGAAAMELRDRGVGGKQ